MTGRLALLLAAALGSHGASAATPAAAPLPNVVLITVDTLRPDALGWVAGRNATPAIDRLAREGFAFPHAVAPAPLTLPSHTSMLTGLLPRRHGVRENGMVLPKGAETLAQVLARRGYDTAAFVSGFPLKSLFGLDRGFARYDDALPAGKEGWNRRSGTDTTAAALEWLKGARSPWFLWIHYYDPHDPYEPPPPFQRPGGPREAYEGSVSFADSAVALLEKGIAAKGGSTVTVLAGDHGEAFGEHGETTHGFFIYDTTVLVPLIFHFPGRIAPARSEAPARLVDITPTLLDLLGLKLAGPVDGTSLAPLLRGGKQEIPAAYVESRSPWLAYGWSPLKALREADRKLIVAPRPELYDLAKDPGEAKNILSSERPTVVRMLAAIERVEKAPARTGTAAQDQEAIAQLRNLGYLGAGVSDREPPANRPDPKDRVAEKEQISEAVTLLQSGRHEESLRLFEAVLAKDPSCRIATYRAGTALVRMGRPADAIPRLEKAVELDPAEPEYRFALADAFLRVGRFADCVPHWMEVLKQQPRRAPAWSNLGAAFYRLGKMEEAASAFAEAYKLEPKDRRIRGNLAECRYQIAGRKLSKGDRTGARKSLAEAVELEPRMKGRAEADAALKALRD